MLRAYGDVGAGSSDLTWQAMVNLGYAVSDSTTVFLGYRYLDYDLTDGPVSVNMSMSGPQLGVGIKF
jgi:opacity protein-like surface antigen